MAVLLALTLDAATRDQHDDLDARMGQYLMEIGGPPAGLMSHVTYPEGDGFVVADVWRSEAEGRSFFEGALRRLVTEAGLSYGSLTARPVWGFARP